ncbi:MAG: hypothetical protein K2N63_12160, partial [Lachnospiraceae bacterium]|nr:hypothetical protein [Lachnospiraceae bacterium]
FFTLIFLSKEIILEYTLTFCPFQAKVKRKVQRRNGITRQKSRNFQPAGFALRQSPSHKRIQKTVAAWRQK